MTQLIRSDAHSSSGPSIAAFVSNDVMEIKGGSCPVFKVAGFDSYKFNELGVTEQFLCDAATYYEKYTNPAHFRELFSLAVKLKEIAPNVPGRRVLDLGTGGGNSLFALIELLGPLEALGVDISPPLLSLCSEVAERDYATSKLSLLCADLYDLNVEPGSVDLVTGSSILHHMIDPGAIVDLAMAALKPGGHAIFCEPFENGHGILRGIYATILRLAEAGNKEPIPADLVTHMRAYTQDFDARKGVGEMREYTQHLDDKWIFTREWFARRGCSVSVIPTHGSGDIFWRQFLVSVRLHNGADGHALPDWAKWVFEAFDDTFSSQQKAETMFTGVVVLTKPKRPELWPASE